VHRGLHTASGIPIHSRLRLEGSRVGGRVTHRQLAARKAGVGVGVALHGVRMRALVAWCMSSGV